MPGQPSYSLPPEMQLLGALCRPAAMPSQASAAALEIDDICRQVGNWPHLLKLVEHHRIAPLAARGAATLAATLPEDVLLTLRERSAANALEAFHYLAELQRVLGLLAGAGIRATVLKGVPLSLIAFGDVAVREVGDIDLLIEPSDAARADAILEGSGMQRKEPIGRLTPKRRVLYATFFKDYTYHPSRGFEIDLHWRLFRDSLASESVLSSEPQERKGSRHLLRIGSMEVEVLGLERCLLYLAVHGALEGWARWKSLADIAALWTRASETERASAWRIAETNALSSYLRAALLLAGDWLGPLPEQGPSPDELAQDGLFGYIVDYTRRQMIENDFMPLPAGASTFAMKRHEARLNPSFRSRRELAGRILYRPRMWETVDLPDPLFFLYPFLSPVEWVVFRLKRFAGRGVR